MILLCEFGVFFPGECLVHFLAVCLAIAAFVQFVEVDGITNSHLLLFTTPDLSEAVVNEPCQGLLGSWLWLRDVEGI